MTNTARLIEPNGGLVQTVAANIRAEAARRGVQQQKLAQLLGMSRTSIGARWWGERQWQLEDIERVARLLGTTPARLCAVRDSNPEPSD